MYSEQILKLNINELPIYSHQLHSKYTKEENETKNFLNQNILAIVQQQKNQQQLQQFLEILETKQKETNLLHEQYSDNQQQSEYTGQYKQIQKKVVKSKSEKPNDQMFSNLNFSVPNKKNKPIIIEQLAALVSNEQNLVNTALLHGYKILLQKSFKLKLENKNYVTNKNSKFYYSDILQLYQKRFVTIIIILIYKSFFNSIKLICKSQPSIDFTANLINQTYNSLKENVLDMLIKPKLMSDDRVLYFIHFLTSLEGTDSKEQQLPLINLAQSYYKNILAKQLYEKTLKKALIRCLIDPDLRKLRVDNIEEHLQKDEIFINNINILKQINMKPHQIELRNPIFLKVQELFNQQFVL